MINITRVDFEYSRACAEWLVALSGFATGGDVNIVVDCHEVVVGVATCADPSGFIAGEGCGKEA